MTSGIIEILIEDAGVQVAVGRNANDTKWKVYPTVCPQGEEQPYITVYEFGLDAVAGKQCFGELDYPKIRVVGNAKNFRDMEVMMEATRNALDGKSASTDAGYIFTNISISDHREGWDEAAQLHVGIQDYRVEQKRTITTT